MKDKEFNSNGDRVSSRDNNGYTCRVDSNRGTCTKNRTGESVNVARGNDGRWGIDTSNIGPRNTFGNSYSYKDSGGFYENDKDYRDYSGGGGNSTGRSYSSYSPQELHISSIVNHIKKTGGTLVGGVVGDYRMQRGEKLDVNYYLMEPIQRMHREHVVGNDHLQGMVFHDCYLTTNDMDYITNMPDWVDYYFNIIDFSHNLGINDTGIYYALRGNYSHEDGIKYKGFLGRDRLHVVKLDLSNCNIGDNGAGLIAEALSDGKLASTKYINLSGNNVTDDAVEFFINALKQPIVQDIIVILKRGYDLKTIVSGSKEDKQRIIKETLQNAQDNGVDVKNVAVSKELGEFIWNNIKIGLNFCYGFAKCNIVPEDMKSFAGERIIAKISKKAFAAYAAKDAVVCFFDTIDDVSTSPEGVQFIKDLDLLGANEVIDSIE